MNLVLQQDRSGLTSEISPIRLAVLQQTETEQLVDEVLEKEFLPRLLLIS